MHTVLPFLLAMVAAIVLLEMWATKLKIAYPILLVVAGLLISFIPGLPKVKINPDLIFFIFLPPLLFEAAWSVSFKEMKKWWRIIGSFAFLVVFFTALSVAVVTNYFIPGFSLVLGFLLGGIVSPPPRFVAHETFSAIINTNAGSKQRVHQINLQMSKEQTKDLLKFLKPFGNDITDLVMWLRDFAWDLCPKANELIYDNYNAVAFGWSPTDKVGHTICSIAVGRSSKMFTSGFIGAMKFLTEIKYF